MLVFIKDLVLMLFTNKAGSAGGARNEHLSFWFPVYSGSK